MAKSFHCSVITPEGTVYDGPADFVTIPAFDGELGILHDRAPLLAKLGAGRLRVRIGVEEHEWFIAGGFAQVLENDATVLTAKAIPPEKIDRAGAEAALGDARRLPVPDEPAYEQKLAAQESARAQLRIAR